MDDINMSNIDMAQLIEDVLRAGELAGADSAQRGFWERLAAGGITSGQDLVDHLNAEHARYMAEVHMANVEAEAVDERIRAVMARLGVFPDVQFAHEPGEA